MELVSMSELGNSLRLMAIPVFLSFVAIVVLFADMVFDREDERQWPAYLTIAGLVGALLLWLQNWLLFVPSQSDGRLMGWLRGLLNIQATTNPGLLFNGMFDPVGIGNMTLIASLLVIVVALVATMLAPRYLEQRDMHRGEYYALLLFATVGLILMAGSVHLILVFLALELLSIPLYILAGFARPNLASEEAGLKYFLLGAFASGFLLYGIALLYGATGTMHLREMGQLLAQDFQSGRSLVLPGGSVNLMLIGGIIMLMVGIGFKISLVPFHQWTPDVYDGAPTPVTAFMIAGTKVGGFAMFINVIAALLPIGPTWWIPMLIALSVLSMLGGNIGALRQTNIKRMLAYSSIAHAGYMMVGVVGIMSEVANFNGSSLSFPALILYLFVYALMNLGAFAVIIAMENSEGKAIIELEEFRGLGRRHPLLALLLAFFLLSLAGFPPTAGFFAKFFLFSGAVLGGQLWLVALAILLSVISVYYYARYIIAMYMQAPAEAKDESHVIRREPLPLVDELHEDVDEDIATDLPAPLRRPSWMVGTALVVTTALVIAIGIYPNPILQLFAP
ncbi:MAG: NADH-quinone oxidoreductase subunit N [Anaerolineales bacterium]|nr:NADH-quinone oxidoreductase subunit N [Anaerolineales bacterium]